MQNLFYYPLKLEDMSSEPRCYHLKADNQALVEITSVLQVPAVKSFSAEITVRLHKKERLADVSGVVSADVEQTSVISLENFIRHYEGDFTLHFDTSGQKNHVQTEEEVSINDDILDVMEDGQIDLAAVALEQLALLLDDFPRQEGEVFSFVSEFDEETTKATNPFAVLGKLKK